MASHIERVAVTKSTNFNKFRFSDYGYAYFVRNKMLDALAHFDTNGN